MPSLDFELEESRFLAFHDQHLDQLQTACTAFVELVGAQVERSGEEAVAEGDAFLLVAHLLEIVGKQILGGLVLRFGIDQLVEQFDRQQILSLVVELLAAGKNLLAAAHHGDILGRRILR